jgi:2-oxoglutarate dehydrogenase E2 component (dihydrolipoamide succinyltransferase)
MVAENDLDLDDIPATGDGGRVTREDVEAYLEQQGEGGKASQQAPDAGPSEQAPQEGAAAQGKPKEAPQPERSTPLEAGERERIEKLPRIRQRIAAKMRESLESAAQLTTVQEADVTAIMRLRGEKKSLFKEREGVSLSPFVFLARAAVLALRKPEHQNVNAQADWNAGEVKYHDYVNLGIAVDTERGLLVPNVKRADDLTLPALAREISTAADKARGKGKLEMADIEGGTFTVTNTGSRGVLIDTPILNYPEVGILGTGAIKKRPVVTDDDAIAIRSMVYLCLTYDHMLLDGADAARFVTDVKDIVETHDWAQEVGY